MLHAVLACPRKFILHAIFLLFSFVAVAQDLTLNDSLKNVLTAREKEMFDAVTNADKPATEKMLAQDYVTINADGVMEDREQMLSKFGKFKGAKTELSERRIRLFGNVAIITGRAKFYMKGILAAEIFYTETWVYRDTQWQFAGWQGTMTGLPAYYPVIGTCILLLVVFLLLKWIIKRVRRSHREKLVAG